MTDTQIRQLDIAAIRSRAIAQLDDIGSLRRLARDAGDPHAELIAGGAYLVAQDAIGLCNSLDTMIAVGTPQAVVFYCGPETDPARIIGAVGRLSLPDAALPVPLPVVPTVDPRQLSLIGEQTSPPAVAPRAEETAISIDAFDPPAEWIAAQPWNAAWILEQLASYRAANAGQTAKRWVTSFRAALQKRPDASANLKVSEASQ